MWSCELDTMILVGCLQLGIFYDAIHHRNVLYKNKIIINKAIIVVMNYIVHLT